MEDYYDELGFEVWDDYKLYEGRKIMKKSIKEERENGFKVSISYNKEMYSYLKPMEFALTSAQLMTSVGGNWAWIDEPTIDESGYMYFESTKDSHSKIEYDFTKVFTIDVDWGNHQIYFYTKGDVLMLHFYRLVDDEFKFLMYGNEKLDGILTRFGK